MMFMLAMATMAMMTTMTKIVMTNIMLTMGILNAPNGRALDRPRMRSHHSRPIDAPI